MLFREVETISNIATTKKTLLDDYKLKYFIRSVFAGFFVSGALGLNLICNNLFAKTNPPVGKMLGGIYFSLAVLLIVMVGGELFTGNTFVMSFGSIDKKVSWIDTLKVCMASYFGNFVGAVLFAVLFYLSGASGTEEYIRLSMPNKVYIPYMQLFVRAILCNFLVCIAILCGIKMKEEVGKIVMIVLVISAFIISGYEHSIANMGYYTFSILYTPEVPIVRLFLNLLIATVGNAIGGGLMLALPLRKMSLDK